MVLFEICKICKNTEHLQWVPLYHCKMHLYSSISIDCNMTPCLFQLTFVFFLPAYIFLQSYAKLSGFYAQ